MANAVANSAVPMITVFAGNCYGAVDGIVDPAPTREVVSASLRAAACNPELPEFRTGVLQT